MQIWIGASLVCSLALELRYAMDPLPAINVIPGLQQGGRGMKEGKALIANPLQLGSILAKSEDRDSHQQRTKHHSSIIMSCTLSCAVACLQAVDGHRWGQGLSQPIAEISSSKFASLLMM